MTSATTPNELGRAANGYGERPKPWAGSLHSAWFGEQPRHPSPQPGERVASYFRVIDGRRQRLGRLSASNLCASFAPDLTWAAGLPGHGAVIDAESRIVPSAALTACSSNEDGLTVTRTYS